MRTALIAIFNNYQTFDIPKLKECFARNETLSAQVTQ